MVHYISKIFVIFLSIFFIGCTTYKVDTLEKRIAVFETGYSVVLKKVKLWITEGTLKGVDKTNAQKRVAEISTIKKDMYLALDVGDINTTTGKLQAANITLNLLRDIIKSKERGVKNECIGYFNCT